jgi:hypothetical protein
MAHVAEKWKRRWLTIDARALESKDSPSAIPAVFDAYRSLGTSERRAVDDAIVQAIESPDETTRFDALALVREFRIATAAAALDRLARRLRIADAPGAPYELEKVQTILAGLAVEPPNSIRR